MAIQFCPSRRVDLTNSSNCARFDADLMNPASCATSIQRILRSAPRRFNKNCAPCRFDQHYDWCVSRWCLSSQRKLLVLCFADSSAAIVYDDPRVSTLDHRHCDAGNLLWCPPWPDMMGICCVKGWEMDGTIETWAVSSLSGEECKGVDP